MVMVVTVTEQMRSFVRVVSLSMLTILSIPFEGLLTNDLQAYIIHPLLVTAVLFLNRHRVYYLLENRAR